MKEDLNKTVEETEKVYQRRERLAERERERETYIQKDKSIGRLKESNRKILKTKRGKRKNG
jgi:hypothetical protein